MPPSNPPTLAAQLAASRAVVEHIGDELPHGSRCWHEPVLDEGEETVVCRCCDRTFWNERIRSMGEIKEVCNPNLCASDDAAMPVLRAMLARETGGLDMLHALETVVGTRAYSGHNDIICALRDMQPHHIVLAAAEVLEGESDA